MEMEGNEQEMTRKAEEQREKLENTRAALKKLIHEGKLPAARPLTRGERRKMDAAGVNIRKIDYRQKGLDAAIDDMTDWILDTLYGTFDFEKLPNNVCTLFAMYIYQLTYEDEIAAKN